jgi:hypothetical protein
MKTTAKERGIMFSAPMVKAIIDGRKGQTRRAVKAPLEWANPKSDGRMMYDLSRAWKDGKPESGEYLHVAFAHPVDGWQKNPAHDTFQRVYAPWEVGDRLWVREGFEMATDGAGNEIARYLATPEIITIYDPMIRDVYWSGRATSRDLDGGDLVWRKMSPLFLPRWASRITLEVTAVKVERLQSISAADAMAEGITIPTTSFEENKRRLKEARELAGGFDTGNCKYAVVVFKELWESIHGKGSWSANPWLWCISFRRVDEAGRGKQNEGRGNG